MHQALYRKWRPQSFEQVCGQEHITSVLKYEIQNSTYTHAYLFCGSRGTGKTTCAKLLAKAVNCLSPINGSPCGHCEACRAIDSGTTSDVLEMDAASNTGVDYIRDIREAVTYAPSMLKNRVYIIDEVHMLSQSAFNALLKTLEEPPSSVVFILATTEQQKIPATILSRCQKFEFRRISTSVISERLMYIAEQESLPLTEDGAHTIAKLSAGGMRDAISLLELCGGNSGTEGAVINASAVRDIAGSGGRENAMELIGYVLAHNCDGIFETIGKLCASSGELTVFWQELMDIYRDMLVIRTTKAPKKYLDLTDDEFNTLSTLAGSFNGQKLLRHCSLLEDAFINMTRTQGSKRLCAEMALMKMCDEKLDTLPEGIAARVSSLEEKLATGNFAPPTQKQGTEAMMFKRSDAPDPHAESDAEAQLENQKKQEVSQSTKSALQKKSGLRPVSWWAEALKRIDPSIACLLKLSRAYADGNKIIIRADGQFAIGMLDNAEMRQKLSELSAAYSPDKFCLPSDFEFIDIHGTDDEKFSALDELMNTADEGNDDAVNN